MPKENVLLSLWKLVIKVLIGFGSIIKKIWQTAIMHALCGKAIRWSLINNFSQPNERDEKAINAIVIINNAF